jgi:trans-2,3-dihydro-3-hydroxyanthranilate isomerase
MNGRPDFAQLTAAMPPEVGPPPPARDTLAAMLSLGPDDVLDGDTAPEALSCGTPFLFVPLRDRAAVGRARVKLDLIEEALRGYLTDKVMVFAMDAERPGHQVRARMFAPSIGVPEDPATGSACVALAGYLATRDPRRDGTFKWVVEQGFEMGRPSILEIEAEKQGGTISATRVGGRTVLVCDGTMTL